jgi:hypothetical protein
MKMPATATSGRTSLFEIATAAPLRFPQDLMRTSILFAILVVAGSASAQPADVPKSMYGPPAPPAPPTATAHRACEVLILRAPYDVRHAIESWVAQETSCWTSLEVRVVPTEGGLYLLAREPNGRLHERLVPDAQSAGVLVASWVANDSVAPVLAPTPPPLASPPPPRRRATNIAPLVSPEVVKPPPHIVPLISPVIAPLYDLSDDARSSMPAIAPLYDPSDDARSSMPAIAPLYDLSDDARSSMPYGRRWLSFGMTGPGSSASGARLRGEFDFWRNGGFAAGTVWSATNTSRDTYGDMTTGVTQLDRFDLRGLVGLSWTVLAQHVRIRLQLAAGPVWSHEFVRDYVTGGVAPEDSLIAAVEASVTLSYELSDGLEFGVTPQSIWYAPDWMPYQLPPDDGGSVMLELRRRL